MFAMFFIVLVAIFAAASAQAVGGWFPVDVSLSQVQEAAVFAVTHKYPNENPSFVVVSAMKQVVAGLKFDMTVAVTIAGRCHMDHFQVWNRFGTLTSVVADTLATACGTSLQSIPTTSETTVVESANEVHKNIRSRAN